MKSLRTVLAGGLALLLAAPPATAQQVLKVRESAQKPAFSFTKDITPPAPIPRLDLSSMLDVQDPDPTGLLGLAAEDDAAGASKWWVGGLVVAGIGGAIAFNEAEKEEPDPTMQNASLVLMGSGLALMLIGTIIHLDHGPQPWIGKTRGGVAGGVRIPIGRR